MYKAIFLDLDGTLLTDDKTVSEENQKAINYAKEKGVEVIICSGRQKDSTIEFKQLAGTGRYVICSNGAQIYDCVNKEELAIFNISPFSCNTLINLAIQNGYYVRLDTNYGRYANSKRFFVKYEILVDNNELLEIIKNEKILQIAIGAETEEQINRFTEIVNENNISDVKIEYTFYNDVADGYVWTTLLLNKNVSKGNAVNGLCRFLKIDTKDVICIGDDKNDISMLKTAGLGVAMGNAVDEVKDIAKEVTLTNMENGVANIINSKI